MAARSPSRRTTMSHRPIMPSRHANQELIIKSLLLAITLAALSPLLLHWRRKSILRQTLDIFTSLTCLAIHSLSQPLPSLLSLSFAIIYTVSVSLPGSLSTDLPTHAEFIRRLKSNQQQQKSQDGYDDKPDQKKQANNNNNNNNNNSPDQQQQQKQQQLCMICWEESPQTLPQLPCGHDACLPCLSLMNTSFQTLCPLCRAPLFASHDPLVLAISKLNLSFMCINWALFTLFLIDEILRRRFFDACVSGLALASISAGLWYWRIMVAGAGEHWWRGNPGQAALNLRILGFAFLSGGWNVWQSLARMRGLF